MRTKSMKNRYIIIISLFFILTVSQMSCEDKSTDPQRIDIPEQPQDIQDGWAISSMDDQQIDPEMIGQLSAAVQDGNFGEIHSMHIARHGHLVVDEYYREDHAQQDIHFLASVTKSIASILIGIAIRQGHILGIHQDIKDFFPQQSSHFDADPRKQSIKLWHLLTMSAGFHWQDGTGANPESDDYKVHITADDAADFILSKTLLHEPGTRFDYNGGCSILLSIIIKNMTGMHAQEYAAIHLFAPLGITDYHFQHIHDGHTDLNGGLSLRPRDLAKLGQLFLNDGRWNGQQIVTEEWINESVNDWIATDEVEHYGFQWWLRPLSNVQGHIPQSNDIFFASGFGGQKLFVIPYLDLIVVFMGSCVGYEITDNLATFALELYVIPSVYG